ncbi:unnamed protein product [Candidula unifasciata]|uniref:Proline-rich transmembrane protein 1 n=1 Tax=Candidula unifasciata TaxID=100452 RepID=A0A8S3YG74_9EUPU|nr:unnamed protein product [Candidula unifasciata]
METSDSNPVSVNPESAPVITTQAQAQPAALTTVVIVQRAPEEVENHLALAVCTCIFCFFPLGIPAIVLTIKTQPHSQQAALKTPTVGVARPAPVKVENYLGLSICICILFCCPCSIPAIVLTVKSIKALNRGDVVTAYSYSRMARWLNLAAVAAGLVSEVVLILLFTSYSDSSSEG